MQETPAAPARGRDTRPHRLRLQGAGLALLFFVISAPVARLWAAEAPGAPSPPPPRLSEVELQIWNDPAFKKRFAESYLAETEIEPPVTADERGQILKALELISADKAEEAVKRLERERARNAAVSAVFDFTLANLHFQAERLEEAAAAYQTAVEKYPRFRRAWKNLGLIRIRQGDFAGALPALTRVVELGGHDATTYGLLGFAYSSVENHLSAESAYRMAVLLDPETMDWKLGLARSFFRQERYADAAALCGRLLAAHPERADLWLLSANAHLGLGQPQRAAEIYELVDHLGQSTPESLYLLGDIYVNEELYEPAAGAYLRALALSPQARPERVLRAAKTLAARGAFPETRRLIERIESLEGIRLEEPERKELLKLRARLAVAEGAGEEEARVLEAIVALDPLDGETLILLGQHRARAGQLEEAAFHYERAAALEAFEADAKVRHAQLLVGQGKYAEALPLLRRAQAVKPRDNIQEYLEQVERVSRSR